MKKNIHVSLLILFLAACSDDGRNNPNTVEYFRENLKKDMDYRAIVGVFGEPVKDIGSGIHIYVYLLDDLTEVRIGFTDKILYASHIDKNDRLLESLL